MNTHANLLAVTGTYAAWVGLAPGDAVSRWHRCSTSPGRS